MASALIFADEKSQLLSLIEKIAPVMQLRYECRSDLEFGFHHRDKEGVIEKVPTTDEEWTALKNHAIVLIEAATCCKSLIAKLIRDPAHRFTL